MNLIGEKIGKIRFKNIDTPICIILIILASFDLFRAYAEVSIINVIFAIKEVIICLIFIDYLIKKRPKISENQIVIFFSIVLFFSINIRFDVGVLLNLVFVKYLIIYFITYLFFSICNLSAEEKSIKLLSNIFLIYSIFSLIQGFFFPQLTVRSGRISGFANPSFLSLIYLYIYVYWISENKPLLAFWFLLSGLITMTKTFFVVAPIVILSSFLISNKKRIISLMLGITLISTVIIVQNNTEMMYTFDRAYKVLIERDADEYNSFEDRQSRKTDFEKYNSGNFLIGYGTATASAATTFVKEKFDITVNHSVDFENQYLNLYYSGGIIGLFIIYVPIFLVFIRVLNYKTSLKNKYTFYIYLFIFLLYGLTLNVIESFTSCIISLLYLIYEERKIKCGNRLSND